MKELSIEEKAKRYDEALEKAHQLCAYPTTKPFISDLQNLFPELMESEDERIRKRLIVLAKGSLAHTDEEINEMIAWLEKQGEQKPVPDWMPKFLDELRSKKNYFDWDEHKDIEGRILAIIKWMNPNYFIGKDGEQKSDNRESSFLTAERAKEVSPFMRSGFENEYAAWSEEDERYLSYAIHAVEDMLGNNGKNTVTWLKSLKDRYIWRPSDEQMKALLKLEDMHVLEHEKNQENAHLYMVVKSIREQLLKLREE